ncbi:MAG: hypothetical protein J6A37_16565 [Oscillospiraceae bacterium]|nr:hypothetical protein [Oscillospiraceae bacterium]
MKNKRLSAVIIALIIMLCLGFTVFGIAGMSFGEWISMDINFNDFPQYTYAEWETMSIDERRTAFENAVIAHGGTPHFTDDFLSDTDSSHIHYSAFTSGYSAGGGIVPNVVESYYLEASGQAELHLGFSNDNYADTPAGELNNEFIDYIQQNPYLPDSGQATTAYKFDNGYYVTWDPLLLSKSPGNYSVDGTIHKAEVYGLQFYLHDENGNILEIQRHQGINSYTPLIICSECGGTLFDNFTITYDGWYYFDYYPWKSPHPDSYNTPIQSNTYAFPWWSLYGTPTEDTVINAPYAVGEDDDGNEIQFQITSDGVIYEGDTYKYNGDNTVTINGDTYYITVDPSTIDPDYYKKFVGDTINNYYYYYTTEGQEFDGKDILSALQSIHKSLESFRTTTYTQLKNLEVDLANLGSKFSSSLKSQTDRIIKALNKLNNSVENLDLSTEENKAKELASWLEMIDKIKKKFCVNEIQANVMTSYNAMFNASYGDSGGSTVATYNLATVETDSNGNTAVTYNSVTTGFVPSITIEFMGNSYNLLSSLHSSSWGPYIEQAKKLISALLTIAFFIGLFRSLPSIIGGVPGISVPTSQPADVQYIDVTDSAEIDVYRPKHRLR